MAYGGRSAAGGGVGSGHQGHRHPVFVEQRVGGAPQGDGRQLQVHERPQLPDAGVNEIALVAAQLEIV